MSPIGLDLKSILLLGVAAGLTGIIAGCAEERPVVRRAQGPAVRVERVQAGEHTAEITVLATVRPSETSHLVAVYGGRISYPQRFASGLRTGARVTEGEMLAEIASQEVTLDLTEARIQSEAAEIELDRKTRALNAGILSESEFSRARTQARLAREKLAGAQSRQDQLVIRSPRSGNLIVSEVISPGPDIPSGAKIGSVAADGAPRVEGWAPGSELASLRPGLKVRFIAPGRDDLTGAGVLEEVGSVVDKAGTVKVIARVTDSSGLPAPGEGVELHVELASQEQVISIPLEAVVIGPSGSSAFVLEGAGSNQTARRVALTLGRSGGGRVEVRTGLNEGDRLVVSGVSLLADSMRVVPVEVDPARSQASADQSKESAAN